MRGTAATAAAAVKMMRQLERREAAKTREEITRNAFPNLSLPFLSPSSLDLKRNRRTRDAEGGRIVTMTLVRCRE